MASLIPDAKTMFHKLISFHLILGIIFFANANLSASDAESSQASIKVTGIGGFFFRAEDPQKLAKWYQTHLGISPVPTTYEQTPWQQEAGSTVFAPFQKDTEYFGDKSQSWMINFRVDDLDAMVAQLRSAGIEVDVEETEYPNGRFARLTDPEGNPIQLWEPKQVGLEADD